LIIIVGLGNPEPSYNLTRHNAGFMLIDRLSEEYGIKCKKAGFSSLWGKGVIAGEDVVLAKPQTYMNLSGKAAAALKKYFDAEASDILVVCDDCELPPGRIRIRKNGGPGSHNGLKSVISELGTKEFPRMRLGVGSAPGRMDLSDYVLSQFSKDERKDGGLLDSMMTSGVEAIEAIITKDIEYAMNTFNPS
jgi:PTH1 family peptidyl-tRNA hydrolase